MKIIVSKHSGFCFGVKRAVSITNEKLALHGKKNIYSLGPLIHNSFVVSELSKKGLKVLKSSDAPKRGVFVIPSHGIEPSRIKRKRGVSFIDATCPFVFKARSLISKLARSGYAVLILGDRNHPEVKGLAAISKGKARVLGSEKEAMNFLPGQKRLSLVCQTTESPENFASVASRLLEKDFHEFRIFNTICNDVIKRQKEAKRVAALSDLVLVIGGKNSANTKRLAELSGRLARTRHVENEKGIKKSWLKGVRALGIVTGASTPGEFIPMVKNKIRELTRGENRTKKGGKR